MTTPGNPDPAWTHTQSGRHTNRHVHVIHTTKHHRHINYASTITLYNTHKLHNYVHTQTHTN